MSLTDLWLKSREQISDKSIGQIIGFAGDGKLKDGSKACQEFRSFLSHVPSEYLERYAEECLNSGFQDSGLVLQDLINQIGSRLGFRVEHGRYRGVTGQIGNDGIWHMPDNHAIVVEVKTTDVYRVDLDKIAEYRQALINANAIAAERSSVLLVVGRKETGDLEAQIRGSRHAWDMRLISVSALCHLMGLKEKIEDPATTKRIYSILVPREFTKLDAIIDIVFSTTEEVQQQGDEQIPEEADERSGTPIERKFSPVAFNDQCIARIEKHLGKRLVKRSKIKFATPDESLAVVCAVSKEYDRSSQPYYWYAFHPHQEQFLKDAHESYVALGCGSEERLLLIPLADFEQWLPGMNVTHKEDRFYYHIQVTEEGGRLYLVRKKGQPKIELTKYLLK